MGIAKYLFLLAFCFFISACHVFRAIRWLGPDQSDKGRMPRLTVNKSTKPFSFSDDRANFSKVYAEYLNQHLRNTHTQAFLVIKGDKLLYDYYSKGKNDSTLFLGFSFAKAFVGSLIGIAQEEGFIKSLQEPASHYIPEWKEGDSSLKQVTIQQLLDMRSGIEIDDQRVGFNSPMTKLYYGKNINRMVFQLKSAPNRGVFRYQNINTQILSLIIERATKQPFISYFEKKIWQKTGTSNNAKWIIDDTKNKTAKTYFGLIATATDFAKLGRLYLNKGHWDNEQVIPKQWIENTTNMDTLLKYGYKNGWWADNPAKDVKGHVFLGEGAFEQYLYVYPEKQLIIVRLGGENRNTASDLFSIITKMANVID